MASPERGAPDVQAWIGRERTVEDVVTLDRARKLAATLDLNPSSVVAGAPLPPGWHWAYFHEAVRRAELGEDGHEGRGAFLPPIPHERRMWAGGRVSFMRAPCIGDEAQRRSTVRSIESKQGRRGPLVFVTVGHTISDVRGVVIEEEQDLVFLDGSDPTDGERARAKDQGEAATEQVESVEPFRADEVTLFRFSALTFNGHRIHYDRRYARSEGYPELVVHGPLLALSLLQAGLRWAGEGAGTRAGPREGAVRFVYRALQPVFCGEAVDLCGRASDGSSELWVRHPERGIAMRATLTVG